MKVTQKPNIKALRPQLSQFRLYIQHQAAKLDNQFVQIFGDRFMSETSIVDAMRYSLFNPGKRLRPLLVLEMAKLLGHQDNEDLLLLALAIEMVHTYSLIHDDLPAMDNDDFRRGFPSAHRQFNEALAILAGDALLTESFGLLTSISLKPAVPQLIRELVMAAGLSGMIMGQVFDINESGKNTFDLADLKDLHRKKTGALITACLRVAVVYEQYRQQNFMKNDSTSILHEGLLATVSDYGQSIGLLFQITDDILDVVGSSVTLGKPIGSDALSGKTTYVSLLGLAEAKKEAKAECRRALSLAEKLPPDRHFFSLLPLYIYYRKN